MPIKAVQQQCCTLGRVRPAPFGLTPEVDMDRSAHRSARLFLCARCRDQVLLCSHCDRGQQYCGRACANASRRERRQDSAERYQRSLRGRRMHAARAACWRRRRRALRQHVAPGDTHKVTHQGCLDAGAQASLLACEIPTACEPIAIVESIQESAPAPPARAGTAAFSALSCRRCAQPLLPHVRQGYLRPSNARRHDAHDHPS